MSKELEKDVEKLKQDISKFQNDLSGMMSDLGSLSHDKVLLRATSIALRPALPVPLAKEIAPRGNMCLAKTVREYAGNNTRTRTH